MITHVIDPVSYMVVGWVLHDIATRLVSYHCGKQSVPLHSGRRMDGKVGD